MERLRRESMAQSKSPSAIGTGMNSICNTKRRWRIRDLSFAEHTPPLNWSKWWNFGIIPGLSPASFILNFRPNRMRLTLYFEGLSQLAWRIRNSDYRRGYFTFRAIFFSLRVRRLAV